MSQNSRSLYARLLSYVRPHWRMFAVSIGAMVVLAATQPAVPALLKPMLDGSFVHKDLGLVNTMALLLVVVFAVRGICSYFGAIALEYVAGRVVMALRGEMYAKLLTLPSAKTDHQAPGTMISKFTFDALQVTDAATYVLTVLVRDSLTIIGLLAWMAYLDWRLTGIALATAPVVVLIVRYFSHRLRTMSARVQDTMGEVTQILDESIAGNKVIRTYGGQHYETERFETSINWARRFQLKFASAAHATAPIAQLVTSVALAIIIYLTARQSAADEVTVGAFVSFFAAMILLFSPIKRLTSVNGRLQRGLAASASVFAFIDQISETDTGEQELADVQGRIEFDNISLRYTDDGPMALDNVSLTIEAGEFVAFVGPSGSGKSSLANLLPRFYVPYRGAVRVNGIDITNVSLASLRAHVAVVSQDIVLFDDTIAANVAYGALRGSADRDIIDALERAQAMDFVQQLPDGIRTRIGPDGTRLSGGQRQRLAIARAFLKNAPILILDEATSSLDSASERAIHLAVESLRAGRTTLVIAHRLSTVESADRIVVMTGGQIAEIGSHQALLASSPLYAGLHRFQFSPDADDDPTPSSSPGAVRE
ncbi:MAG: lipid A export permease/ATP-binding protein MsbA [Pseudomonadota bacterium]